MCLITFLPPGVAPDLDALHAGALFNPDGHGYALADRGRILLDRHRDPDLLVEWFAAARRAHPDAPALFHSRLATHGTISRANCHPFAVGGDRRTVLAHNGILPTPVRPGRRDRRSDSRIAAEEFLPSLGPLYRAGTRRRVEKWMGPGNKMVILTVDPRYPQRAYLLNEQSGVWHGGAWYSNDGFRDLGFCLDTGPVDVERCVCGGPLDAETLICGECGLCLECFCGPDSCCCWEDDRPAAPPPPGPSCLNTAGPRSDCPRPHHATTR
ncbi:class II glutamine amidotransferase [Actinocatenispora rupis]|uniref:Glutamine amidotransferase type-2 domain-containing protein n=1 Tax=Actinocatenispora rupis TaxID=519421 RepID=A0A8J3NAY5_9ACTN|nr:class II glutamine amidotransferase [Actinocatenispora rupis]GID10205.1 hypothetical protein Aru02nite_10940 [Actinocatenispora rupis]